MILIKSEKEIELMREPCRIVGLALQKMEEAIKPGMTTKDLDKIAEIVLRQEGAKPSFKGQMGFEGSKPYPAIICASVNQQVIHGIPDDYVLKEGDIVSVDMGAYKNGYHGDAARTFAVGEVSAQAKKLIEVTKQSFFEGIKMAKAGNRVSDISHAVQAYAESFGFSVVRDFVGHGVGKELHEEPQVPNYGKPGRGPRLQKGMVIAVEPMINEGTFEIDILKNGWTVVTCDGKLSAHYENTIAITDGEPEILTKV
ncbi:MAG: type I methionyl aminopeptidase [Clostridia bacterium]|nr:type I methionyl aminopeptidase [Clostridia bacterium]